MNYFTPTVNGSLFMIVYQTARAFITCDLLIFYTWESSCHRFTCC